MTLTQRQRTTLGELIRAETREERLLAWAGAHASTRVSLMQRSLVRVETRWTAACQSQIFEVKPSIAGTVAHKRARVLELERRRRGGL